MGYTYPTDLLDRLPGGEGWTKRLSDPVTLTWDGWVTNGWWMARGVRTDSVDDPGGDAIRRAAVCKWRVGGDLETELHCCGGHAVAAADYELPWALTCVTRLRDCDTGELVEIDTRALPLLRAGKPVRVDRFAADPHWAVGVVRDGEMVAVVMRLKGPEESRR